MPKFLNRNAPIDPNRQEQSERVTVVHLLAIAIKSDKRIKQGKFSASNKIKENTHNSAQTSIEP